jgi:hypothetical protein
MRGATGGRPRPERPGEAGFSLRGAGHQGLPQWLGLLGHRRDLPCTRRRGIRREALWDGRAAVWPPAREQPRQRRRRRRDGLWGPRRAFLRRTKAPQARGAWYKRRAAPRGVPAAPAPGPPSCGAGDSGPASSSRVARAATGSCPCRLPGGGGRRCVLRSLRGSSSRHPPGARAGCGPRTAVRGSLCGGGRAGGRAAPRLCRPRAPEAVGAAAPLGRSAGESLGTARRRDARPTGARHARGLAAPGRWRSRRGDRAGGAASPGAAGRARPRGWPCAEPYRAPPCSP